MFEDLDKIVKGQVEPTMWTGISALVAAFELHKATLWKEQVTNLVMIGDNEEASTLVDRVLGILYGQAEALFQQMLIRVELEDLRVGKLAELVEALAFEPNDQDGEILAAMMASEDAVEALCDAVAIKTGMEGVEWMEFIQEVSPFTIEALTKVVNRSVERQQVTQEDVQVILGRVNKYTTLIPAGTSIAMEALGTGVQPGTSMSTLVEKYKDRMDVANHEAVVDHMISLALLSNTPPDCVEEEVQFFLEQVYPELFDMQKANKILTKRLGALAEEF